MKKLTKSEKNEQELIKLRLESAQNDLEYHQKIDVVNAQLRMAIRQLKYNSNQITEDELNIDVDFLNDSINNN